MFNSVKSENAFSHNNKRSVKRVKTREGDNKRRWITHNDKKMPISVFTCVIVHLSEYTIFFSIEDTTISDRLNGRGFFFLLREEDYDRAAEGEENSSHQPTIFCFGQVLHGGSRFKRAI